MERVRGVCWRCPASTWRMPMGCLSRLVVDLAIAGNRPHFARRGNHDCPSRSKIGIGTALLSQLVVGQLFAAIVAMALPTTALGQFRDVVPRVSYYLAIDELYSGEYRNAERDLRREVNHGVRTVQARWIDSICHHAMLGEVLFNQGRNAEALAQFDQACQILLTYPNWLLRVQFQQAPRPDLSRARRAVPWGKSQRQFVLGQFPDTEKVLMGQLDNSRAIRQGGVVSMPEMWRINAIEIVRASALAMRRRNQILGPLGKYDPISKELAEVFSRGGLAPPNHWSGAWIDLQRGIALAGVDKGDEALKVLDRSIVIDGQFDHSLTCVALLEQGRLALDRGDVSRAATLLAEASYSAYYYLDRDVITESLMLGWINHIGAGGQGIFAPLNAAASWAQANRLMHIAVKLRLAEAESAMWGGASANGAALVDDVNRRIGDMRAGLPGIHLLYVQSIAQLLQGRLEPSGNLLQQALAAQARASLTNMQVLRTSELFDGRQVSPRVAVQLYESLLADPSPLDWTKNPLDAMASLQSNHDPAFDRWFVAALERKEVPLALEVSEQAKRRRYLMMLPLGGRVLALRTILEAPVATLSPEGVLQRQQFLAGFPIYGQLGATSADIERKLRAGPVIAPSSEQARSLADQFEAWDETAHARERVLLELALRRVPTSLEFPPSRKTPDIQKSLDENQALVVFHATAGGIYGIVASRNDTNLWQVGNEKQLRGLLSTLLKEIGNYGPNKTLSLEELSSDAWREPAAQLCKLLFADSRIDLEKTKSLVIVPDGLLWHLPFELLLHTDGSKEKMLSELVPICYGPTAALSVADRLPARRTRHTGIVANSFATESSPSRGDELISELESAVVGPVRLPSPLPERSGLIAPLLDTLIVFDEPESRGDGAGWALLPRSKGKESALESWFGLPYGGPQRIVATGISTAAEQGLKNSRRSGATRPGDELFRAVTNAMASGARTILLSRWRTGGRTNFDLVREFVQELPHMPAAESWQRAVVLAREAPLDAAREPRLKRSDEVTSSLTAEHPFFWAGYLLVDSGANPAADKASPEANEAEKPTDAKSKEDKPKEERSKDDKPKQDRLQEDRAKEIEPKANDRSGRTSVR